MSRITILLLAAATKQKPSKAFKDMRSGTAGEGIHKGCFVIFVPLSACGCSQNYAHARVLIKFNVILILAAKIL